MNRELFELYSDYLLSSFGQTAATSMSSMLDNQYSHDQITRLLSRNNFDSKTLWQKVKPTVRQIEQEDAVLIIDDTIQEKPYSDENDLICWHYDHTKGRTLKGINLLNCLYHSDGVSVPIAYELIKKDIHYFDIKTKNERRKCEHTKNHYLREIVQTCCQNQLKFQYVLADSWFASKENMNHIRKKCNKHFIMALKSNRQISLSEEDKKQGRTQRIDSLDFSEEKPIKGWLSGVSFPVLLFRQVFKNKDDSEGILYLVCSDLNCDDDKIKTTYKKRWNVETFHKTIKSNAAMAKSPAHAVRTQSNHIFLSLYSAFRLEKLSIKSKLNHFQLKGKLYLKAIQAAFQELGKLRHNDSQCVT
jgi:hypothetical protein